MGWRLTGILLWLIAAAPEAATSGELEKDDLAHAPPVWRLRIEVPPDAMAALRVDARKDVRATLREGRDAYPNVGLHLKGSTGSFRPLEDKPAMTLDFTRFGEDRRFHGLRKLHLNNSVEDPGYLNEQLGSELFRAAGVPAPRVTHALVTLNGRPLGLFVLKEGFTEDFLTGYFKRLDGQLYENDDGFGGESLERRSDRGSRGNRTELEALAAAARDPDLDRRWRRLGEVLDINRFVTFMAMEIMLCHRDGYCLARNNFRVYHDRDTGRMVFFPHGMDQLLGKSDLPWQPHMGGPVAQAIMETPEGRQRYAECFSALFTRLFLVESLTNRVRVMVSELRPYLGAQEFEAIQREAALVRERIARRRASLSWQLSQPTLAPLEFSAGVAPLTGWSMVDPPVGGTMDQASSSDGVLAWHIRAGPATAASWRTRAVLKPGRYRFEAKAKVAAVKPLAFGKHQGAGLRLGNRVPQSEYLTGDSSWQTLETEFQVTQATEEIEFVGELRAAAGDFWLDAQSLRVVQIR